MKRDCKEVILDKNLGLAMEKNKTSHNFMFIRNKKAQSTVIEYSVFVVCIILALIAMQGYIIRGMQGGLRRSADSIGTQYEPTKTSVDFTLSSRSDIFTNVTVEEVGGVLISNTTVDTNLDEQTRIGTEIVGAF